MKIGFVGAGKVGTNFARYFVSCDLIVSGFFVRTDTSRKETFFDVFEELSQLIHQSDVIFLTVRDDEIQSVVESVKNCGMALAGKAFAHTSGSHSLEDLKPLEKMGASIFTMHPLQTFNSKAVDPELMRKMHVFVENGSSDQLRAILAAIGNPAHEISTEDKSRYHLAASIISNLSTALIDWGFGIMEGIGIEQKDSREAFQSLIEGTINNILADGTVDALTGPVKRGDVHTIEKHLEALDDDQVLMYKLLAKRSLDMAKSSLNEEKYESLSRLLGKDEENV